MIDNIVRIFAPHICEGCGVVGTTLCRSCNFYIIKAKYTKCVQCRRQIGLEIIKKYGNMCATCNASLPFHYVTVVGDRKTLLKRLVGNFKYFCQRESAMHIGRLLNASLPDDLPKDIVIVPIPTAPKHIRERGFDHMKLVAKCVAKDLNCKTVFCLRRLNNSSQHNVSAAKRRLQAEKTFAFDNKKPSPKNVILIDDIYTTGATVLAAAKILKDNGVKEVWLAVVARQ